jgi:Domain of unknown function (DUF1707)
VPTPTRLRASDADRQQTVHELQDAAVRGLLTPDEAGERMAAAYADGLRSRRALAAIAVLRWSWAAWSLSSSPVSETAVPADVYPRHRKEPPPTYPSAGAAAVWAEAVGQPALASPPGSVSRWCGRGRRG